MWSCAEFVVISLYVPDKALQRLIRLVLTGLLDAMDIPVQQLLHARWAPNDPRREANLVRESLGSRGQLRGVSFVSMLRCEGRIDEDKARERVRRDILLSDERGKTASDHDGRERRSTSTDCCLSHLPGQLVLEGSEHLRTRLG